LLHGPTIEVRAYLHQASRLTDTATSAGVKSGVTTCKDRIMPRLFSTLLLLLALLVPTQLFAAAIQKDQTITLNLPESVLSQAIREMLPLDIEPSTAGLKGSITIIGVDDLRITEQTISCRLKLSGKKLQILTELAGHQISLKVGAIELNFTCSTRLRFDSARQVLYIKPTIKGISSSKPSNTDIGSTLLPLLNGREYPITMKNLAPLIAETRAKTVAITMHISNVRAIDGALQLSISPRVSSTPHPAPKKGMHADNS
jgi:hypothetical protein